MGFQLVYHRRRKQLALCILLLIALYTFLPSVESETDYSRSVETVESSVNSKDDLKADVLSGKQTSETKQRKKATKQSDANRKDPDSTSDATKSGETDTTTKPKTKLTSAKPKKMRNVLNNVSVLAKKEPKYNVNSETNPIYARLLDKFSDSFVEKSMTERCQTYFETLYETEPEWSVKPHKAQYDDNQLNEIVSNMKHLNVYASCFLNGTVDEPDSNQKAYKELVLFGHQDIDSRAFPYISRKLPIYVRWTGEQVIGPPDMKKYANSVTPELSDIDLKNLKSLLNYDNNEVPIDRPFFSEFKSKVNGKGIVLSVSDALVNDTLSLIRSLRSVGNKLPIQIVHRNDLSIDSKWLLIKEARREDIYYPEKLYNELYSLKNKDFDPTFPKAELWFVDISKCLHSDYLNEFAKFYNKLLAFLFNSFDEILLVDCDAVIFRNPESFFQTSQYRNSNSLFFRDRSLVPKVFDNFIDFLKMLLPTEIDTEFFGIPEATYKTLGLRYFTLGFGHLMEAGVVAMKRTDFWKGIFPTLHLSLIRPVHENVWGDKELFWLGQSIAGNENYQFNDYWTASVGQLTPRERRPHSVAQELCSTHPGHISSDDDRLMWINSGVLNCRNLETYETDFDVYKSTLGFETKEELKEYYNSVMTIEHGLIPPDSLYWVESFKTPKEPRQGFIKNYNCGAYLWCAYDKIGGSQFPEHQGQVFEFDKEDTLLFSYVGQIYVGER